MEKRVASGVQAVRQFSVVTRSTMVRFRLVGDSSPTVITEFAQRSKDLCALPRPPLQRLVLHPLLQPLVPLRLEYIPQDRYNFFLKHYVNILELFLHNTYSVHGIAFHLSF